MVRYHVNGVSYDMGFENPISTALGKHYLVHEDKSTELVYP